MTDVPTSTSQQLRAGGEDLLAAILAHPFLDGLGDGTLPRAAFRHYVVQDAHYLRGYARALRVLAARAPDGASAAMFAEHATGAVDAVLDLPDRLEPGPQERSSMTSAFRTSTRYEWMFGDAAWRRQGWPL
jgi:thiaminase